MNRWVDRLLIVAYLASVVLLVLLALFVFITEAKASPLSIHAHQSNLYGGTRAEVRVYADVKAKRAGRATILVEALDTSHGNYGAAPGGAGIAHVHLHRGKNRIHRTVTVERIEQRYCFWRPEHRLEHPECPFLTAYHHDPYVGVAAVFDRVEVSVSVVGKPLAERVTYVQKSNAPAAPKRPGAGHGGLEPQ